MQSCLEKKGIAERETEILRSDYNQENPYSATNKDAISDGTPLGKGTGHGGHGAWVSDCNKPAGQIDYSNFDTFTGGGVYDIDGRDGIGGRRASMVRSKYNEESQYGINLIDTSENLELGQFQVK